MGECEVRGVVMELVVRCSHTSVSDPLQGGTERGGKRMGVGHRLVAFSPLVAFSATFCHGTLRSQNFKFYDSLIGHHESIFIKTRRQSALFNSLIALLNHLAIRCLGLHVYSLHRH